MPIPLILLPGLCNDGGLWAAQIRDLADIADPIVGDTLHDDSLPAMAERVLADAPDRFALAGLSMGGYLAFEIMRRAPDLVAKLALLDTSARADTPEQTANRRAAIAKAEGGDFAALSRQTTDTLVADATPQDIRDTVTAMSVRVGKHVYVRQQEAIIGRPDSRPGLSHIAVPTLVLVGEHDMLTPPERAQEIADGIAGARLEVVPGSGHLSAIEAPDIVTARMREWLTA